MLTSTWPFGRGGRATMVRTRKPRRLAASASKWTQVEQPSPWLEEVKPQLIAYLLQEQEKKVAADLKAGAKIERFNPDGTPVQEPPPAPPAGAETPADAPANATPFVEDPAHPPARRQRARGKCRNRY